MVTDYLLTVMYWLGADVIDLTLSDSEDEETTPEKTTITDRLVRVCMLELHFRGQNVRV